MHYPPNLTSPRLSVSAAAAGHQAEADSALGPRQMCRHPPHRAVDAGIALQWQRPRLEPRDLTAHQIVRGEDGDLSAVLHFVDVTSLSTAVTRRCWRFTCKLGCQLMCAVAFGGVRCTFAKNRI